MEERLKEEKNGAALLKKQSEMFMKVLKIDILLKQDIDTIFDDVIENIKLLLKCDRASFLCTRIELMSYTLELNHTQDSSTKENRYHEIRISASTGL